jgi:uncharacterized protein (UPF0335 family)
MATVRFSDSLRSDIADNARRMFDERISKARENPPNWAGNIYDLAFGESVAKMNEFPDGYFNTDTDINFHGFEGGTWNEELNEGIRMYFSEDKTERRRFPHTINKLDNATLGVHGSSSYSWTLDATDPRWDSIKEEYEKYCRKINKLEQEQKAFVSGVKEVINTYSTLAPALKAWPALWDLVPQDRKEKHREIVERKKASDTAAGLAKEVDLSKLTGQVTANKLTR